MTSTIAKAMFISSVALCLPLATAKAASPAAEAQFISEVRTAFDTKDAARLLALVCWDGVEPSMRQHMEQQFQNLMSLVPTKIELIAPDLKERYEYSRGGNIYRTNLAVTKQLNVEFRSGNQLNTAGARMPLGEKEGRLLITTAVPMK